MKSFKDYNERVPNVPSPIHFKYAEDLEDGYKPLDHWVQTNDNHEVSPSNNPRDLIDILHKNQKELPSIEHRKAIDNYRNNFRRLNSALANKIKLAPQNQKAVDHLNELINTNPLKHDLHVYTSIESEIGNPRGIIRSDGFMTATTNKQQNLEFHLPGKINHILHFHLKPGDKAFHLGGFTKENDGTTLLPRGQKYKIDPTPDRYQHSQGSRYHIWHVFQHNEE